MEESVATAEKLMPPGSTTRAANSGDGFKQQTVPEMDPAPAGANREISVVFSKFVRVLKDQVAADTSRMKELEGILAEARDVEFYLKEKKQHLRQMLAEISDKLQG